MSGQTDPDESVLAAVDQGIAAEKQAIREIKVELRRREEALTRLEQSRAVLTKKRTPRRKSSGAKTALQRAGRSNVTKALDFLQHNGPTAKSALTRALEINDGTVHYALLALEEQGQARKTGEKVRGSAVYEYVTQSRRAVTRPGDRS